MKVHQKVVPSGFLYVFISHMVQMKGCDTRDFMSSVQPLYPTWFRWKPNRFNITLCFTKLYIPHGSDESFHRFFPSCNRDTFISHMVQMKGILLSMTATQASALYPTWFRWKAVQCCLCIAGCSLYIPHGSDESLTGSISRFASQNFISHMVQMKALTSLLWDA